jgi:hypothetical protein
MDLKSDGEFPEHLATRIAPEDAHDNPTAWAQMETTESTTLATGFHRISVAP